MLRRPYKPTRQSPVLPPPLDLLYTGQNSSEADFQFPISKKLTYGVSELVFVRPKLNLG